MIVHKIISGTEPGMLMETLDRLSAEGWTAVSMAAEPPRSEQGTHQGRTHTQTPSPARLHVLLVRERPQPERRDAWPDR